jgi:hypothetical protein
VRVVDALSGPAAEPEPPMDCVDVRDRLTEYALSLLPAEELEPVERHLAWCAGCRKEAAELAGGAAAAAMSLPQADPPAELEERIVREIKGAAAAPKRSRGRGRSRAIILIAATLAVFMGLGWAATFGRLQTAEQARDASLKQAQSAIEGFQKLSNDLLGGKKAPQPGDTLLEVQLVSEPDRLGGGRALVFLSPHRPDWVLVYVGGVDPRAGPYGVTVQNPDGDVISLGQQRPDSGGGVTLFLQYPRSLASYSRIVVTDRRGHVVMTGTADRVAARPTTVD